MENKFVNLMLLVAEGLELASAPRSLAHAADLSNIALGNEVYNRCCCVIFSTCP
jgi:hypothetical protein